MTDHQDGDGQNSRNGMTSTMTGLQELSPGGIWIGERKLWFSGVRLRSRMTVVRLADGRLWVHSASEPTPELCVELDRLGPVSWVVVPNRFHHIHAAAMKARYPLSLIHISEPTRL